MINRYYLQKKIIIVNVILVFFANLLLGNFFLFLNASENNSLLKKNNVTSNKKNVDLKNTENNKNIGLEEDFYIIGPGDTLELKLFGAPEFSSDIKVLNDGSIAFPLIGNQKINNLTIDQASKLIQEKYAKQILRPELQLTVKFPRPIRVSVVGEVERPGIYTLTNNNISKLDGNPDIQNVGLPTIIDAIQKGGGVTQEANLKELVIKRRLPGNKNEYKTAKINLLDMVLEGDQTQNIFLFDGDIIKLKKAYEISNIAPTIAKTNLSPRTISVNIVGKVNSPGKLEIMANTPLIQAIYMAGGPVDWKANKGRVELIRINKDGSATRKKFKLNLSEGLSENKNPPLMNQDIVFVRSNTLNNIGTGLGTISESISPAITALTLFKLLE